MPTTYASELYTKDRFFFIKLLFHWTGSVWKLLWLDFLVFIGLYLFVAILYLNVFYHSPEMRTTFEEIVYWLKDVRSSVPLSFMLGFFVSTVVSRWWNVVLALPKLGAPTFCCQALIQTSDPSRWSLVRQLRLSILRYMNLSWIIHMTNNSLHLKERFGFVRYTKYNLRQCNRNLTWKQKMHLMNSDPMIRKYYGILITEPELNAYEETADIAQENELDYKPDPWLPLLWCMKILRLAKSLGFIDDERQFMYLVNMIRKFREQLNTVESYAETNIPLVYTQVAVLAVYLYLASTIISSQLVPNSFLKAHALNSTERHTSLRVMSYFPIAGILEFVFYLGWFKIGICLVNALGRDEADIPLSEIMEYNLRVSLLSGSLTLAQYPPGFNNTADASHEEIAIEFLSTFNFDNVMSADKFQSSKDADSLTRKENLINQQQQQQQRQQQQQQQRETDLLLDDRNGTNYPLYSMPAAAGDLRSQQQQQQPR